MSSTSSHKPNAFPLLQQALENPPFWASEKLIPWDENPLWEPFVCADTWCDKDSINVFSVVGTRNSSYYGMSWLEFLQNGKRMHANHHLFVSNPSYYTNDEQKLPVMSYISLDGSQFFVDDDGNHRTCIARFAFDQNHAAARTNLHGVTTRVLTIDWLAMQLCADIRKVLKHTGMVTPIKTKPVRHDAAGCKRDTWEIAFKLDRYAQASQTLTLQQAKDWVAQYKSGFWGRWFNKSKA